MSLALDRVDLEIYPGEVHALCGENGAGKSTLMKVLAGVWPASSYEGRILRPDAEGGEPEALTFNAVNDATAAGIAIVHQELALMPEMTVLDNLFLGNERAQGGVILDKVGQREEAMRHFTALGFSPPLDALVKELSIGQQQRLEIARALLMKPSVLVLDEPTSALPEDDAQNLLEWIRELADSGTACVYISHRMEEVFKIADRVTVLRDGHTVWTKLRTDIEPAQVIEAMVDRPPTDMYDHDPLPAGNLLLELKNIEVVRHRRTILSIDGLKVHAGEIVGLAGMMGSGRTCLLRMLMGSLQNSHVTGQFRGPEDGALGALPRHPAEAMKKGLFLIPEDRKTQALLLGDTLTTNMTMATWDRYKRQGTMDRGAQAATCRDMMGRFGVKANSPETLVRTLSGGNQQKVLLGRAAEVAPRLLLLDEPTRGIDVGTKKAIYHQMETWTAEGWGILWSSSELQELLGISDRVYVLANGRRAAHFDQRPFHEPDIMAHAAAS